MKKNKIIDYSDDECLSYFGTINQIDYYIKMIEKQCRALYQKNQITEMASQNCTAIDTICMHRLGYREFMMKKGEWGTSKDVLTYVDQVSREMCVERIEKSDNDLLEKLSRMHQSLERVCGIRTKKNFRPSEHSKGEDKAIYFDLSQVNQKLNEIYQMDSKLLEPYHREISEATHRRRYKEKRGRILSEMKRIAVVAGLSGTIAIVGLNIAVSMGEKNLGHKLPLIEFEDRENSQKHLDFQVPSQDTVIQENDSRNETRIIKNPYLENLTYDKLKVNRGIMGKDAFQEGLKMLAEEAVDEMSPEVISCIAQAAKDAANDKNNTFTNIGVVDLKREDKEIAIDCMKMYYEVSINHFDSGNNTAIAPETFFLRYATRNLINYNTACLYNKPIGSTGIYSKTLDKASLVWKNANNVSEELCPTIILGKEKNTLEKFVMQSIKLAPLCRKNPMGSNGDVEYNNIVGSFLKGSEYSLETLLDLTSVIERTHHMNDTKTVAKGESR